MRAVMSVLRAAAANKQRSPDSNEDVLMLRSIKDVNEPKFLAPDIPLFKVGGGGGCACGCVYGPRAPSRGGG